MADDVRFEVLIQDDTALRVDIEEPTNTVTVDPDDPSLVSVATAGVVTSHTSLLAVWAHPDTLSVRTGVGLFYFPVAATLIGVSCTANGAPTGDDIIVDVNKNDVTIFTDQGNRPVIPDGLNLSGETTSIDDPAVDAGDYLSVDIDQIGSVIPGANLTVTVRYRL